MKKTYILLYFGLVIFLGFFLVLNAHDTWMPSDIRLDSGDPPGANFSRHPQIACSGDNVYAVWNDTRNGNRDIYFNYSTDGGATWQASDIRLDSGDSPGASSTVQPKIACEGSTVCAVYSDQRNGNMADIYMNYSTDGGVNWLPSDVRVDVGDGAGTNYSYESDISVSGNQVFIVWNESRNGNPDIFCNYITLGDPWTPGFRVDAGDPPGVNTSVKPHIANSDNFVFVIWQDFRNGLTDIYLNFSTNNGEDWQNRSIRLDSGDLPGDNSSHQAQIAASGNNMFAVWYDDRNGSSDIYFNTMAPPDLDIKANDSDDPITITRADLLSITIEMKAGTLRGQDSDWWIIAQTPRGLYHYEKSSGWLRGVKVSHQGPLSNLPLSEILSMSGLPVGSYTFYFGVDLKMDGKLSYGRMFSDMIEVTITP